MFYFKFELIDLLEKHNCLKIFNLIKNIKKLFYKTNSNILHHNLDQTTHIYFKIFTYIVLFLSFTILLVVIQLKNKILLYKKQNLYYYLFLIFLTPIFVNLFNLLDLYLIAIILNILGIYILFISKSILQFTFCYFLSILIIKNDLVYLFGFSFNYILQIFVFYQNYNKNYKNLKILFFYLTVVILINTLLIYILNIYKINYQSMISFLINNVFKNIGLIMVVIIYILIFIIFETKRKITEIKLFNSAINFLMILLGLTSNQNNILIYLILMINLTIQKNYFNIFIYTYINYNINKSNSDIKLLHSLTLFSIVLYIFNYFIKSIYFEKNKKNNKIIIYISKYLKLKNLDNILFILNTIITILLIYFNKNMLLLVYLFITETNFKDILLINVRNDIDKKIN